MSEENEIKELIENAKESAMILDELVVQSQIDESGNLSTFANLLFETFRTSWYETL